MGIRGKEEDSPSPNAFMGSDSPPLKPKVRHLHRKNCNRKTHKKEFTLPLLGENTIHQTLKIQIHTLPRARSLPLGV